MAENGKNRRVFPLAPTARGYTISGEYITQVGDREIVVLPVQADLASDSELPNVSKSKQDMVGGKLAISEVRLLV